MLVDAVDFILIQSDISLCCPYAFMHQNLIEIQQGFGASATLFV